MRHRSRYGAGRCSSQNSGFHEENRHCVEWHRSSLSLSERRLARQAAARLPFEATIIFLFWRFLVLLPSAYALVIQRLASARLGSVSLPLDLGIETSRFAHAVADNASCEWPLQLALGAWPFRRGGVANSKRAVARSCPDMLLVAWQRSLQSGCRERCDLDELPPPPRQQQDGSKLPRRLWLRQRGRGRRRRREMFVRQKIRMSEVRQLFPWTRISEQIALHSILGPRRSGLSPCQ